MNSEYILTLNLVIWHGAINNSTTKHNYQFHLSIGKFFNWSNQEISALNSNVGYSELIPMFFRDRSFHPACNYSNCSKRNKWSHVNISDIGNRRPQMRRILFAIKCIWRNVAQITDLELAILPISVTNISSTISSSIQNTKTDYWNFTNCFFLSKTGTLNLNLIPAFGSFYVAATNTNLTQIHYLKNELWNFQSLGFVVTLVFLSWIFVNIIIPYSNNNCTSFTQRARLN